MNRAAAVGFLAGVLVLAAAVGIYGVPKRQDKPRSPGQLGAAAAKEPTPGSEESTEADSGRKLLDVSPPAVNAFPGESAAKVEAKRSGFKMSRSMPPGGYRAGQAVDVFVGFEYAGTDKVTALALVERIPAGWSFQEVSGGAKPVIMPGQGATGELTFVWVQVPSFPCTLSYRIVPGPEAAGPQEVQGQAVYRQLGPEQRTEMLKTVVSSSAP